MKINHKDIFKVWGPAWLVMIADVDAASVITAAVSGAQYGTKLIWFLLVLAVPLYIIQEVAGRVGAVTNKGLGELIRQNYSKQTAIFAAVPMALVDIISYVVEYTGAAVGFEILGIPPQISVPIVFIAHVVIVYKKKYVQAEKPLLIISVLFALTCLVSAYLTARNGIVITPFYISTSPEFFFLLAANVGAVIMPFMLFYQASATAEKGITAKSLNIVRLETALGAIVSELIMIAVAVAAIGIDPASLDFVSPHLLSLSLSSVAGSLAPYVSGIGLIAASFIALIVISLGSCWGVTEALGWGRKNWFKVYLFESIPAVIIPLVTLNLVNLALNLMVLQIVVLFGPAIILGLIASNKSLMGSYILDGLSKTFYWTFLVLIFATGIVSVVLLI
jgi:manganese transport protein